jgi:hypothetical protein
MGHAARTSGPFPSSESIPDAEIQVGRDQVSGAVEPVGRRGVAPVKAEADFIFHAVVLEKGRQNKKKYTEMDRSFHDWDPEVSARK